MGIEIEGHKLMHHIPEVANWLTNKSNVNLISVELSPSSNGKLRDSTIMSKSILDRLSSKRNLAYCAKSVVIAGEGEPLLNPHIIPFIQDMSSKIDVAMSTNGILLTPDKFQQVCDHLKWIRFSINGYKESYNVVHNVNQYDNVINNIKSAVEIKNKYNSDITIGTQCVLMHENLPDISKLTKELKSIGVDYFSIKPYYADSRNIYGPRKITINDAYMELKEAEEYGAKVRWDSFNIDNKPRKYNKCYGHNFMCRINADGNVYLCLDKVGSEKDSIGSLKDKDLYDIWYSEKRLIMSSKYTKVTSDCRCGCRYDKMNIFLNKIKDRYTDDPHFNFI